jgi:hypothetical protein
MSDGLEIWSGCEEEEAKWAGGMAVVFGRLERLDGCAGLCGAVLCTITASSPTSQIRIRLICKRDVSIDRC